MEELGNPPTVTEKQPRGCFKTFMSVIWSTRNTSDVKENREVLAQKMLRELIIYLIFIIVVCIIAFGITSPYTYYYTKVMMDLFLEGGKNDAKFKDITSVDEFWEYVKGPLTDGLYWKKWYNDDPLGKLDGYIYYENKLLGLPRLRQVRVKPDSCYVTDEFQSFIDSCYGPYDDDDEDKSPFGKGLNNVSNLAWYHRSSDQIDGFWHWGKIDNYEGGGYVQDLSLDRTKAEEAITDLFTNLWIQRGTRAAFISFTVYNANINLFCIIRLTVEFPATGGAFPSWSFNTVKLLPIDSGFEKFISACQIIFCLFILYYLIEEAIEILFEGRAYFKEFWNVLDILLVISSASCVGFQIYKFVAVVPYLPDLLADFTKYQDFASLAFWEARSNNTIAITVFLSWVKVFKYISFNKTMTQLATTLSRCAKDLLGFFIMFFIVFLAFTQLGYLLFGNQVEDFSTFMNSFFTLFRIILGDFNFYQLEQANRILGPIFFMLFVFFVFFVLINMFLAIINDTYSEVKSDMSKQTDMFIMSDYLKQSYNRLVTKIWQNKETHRLENLNKQYTSKKKISVKEWEKQLVEQGFEEALVEAVFSRFGLEPGDILDPTEQKKIIMEIQRKRNIEMKDEDEEEVLEEGKATEYVSAEEFAVVMRRVDRMETTLFSLVGNIDAVLINIKKT